MKPIEKIKGCRIQARHELLSFIPNYRKMPAEYLYFQYVNLKQLLNL